MKILHIVIYSSSSSMENVEDGSYENMYSLMSEFYKKKKENVFTYFIRFREDIDGDFLIEDDILNIKGKESFIPGILDKTIKSFEIFKDLEYDYLVRSNISTIINFDKLIQYLTIKPILYYGGGHCKNLNWISISDGIVNQNWCNTIFSNGTSIIFTKNAIIDIINNKNIIKYDIIDDVSLSIFVREFKPGYIPEEIKHNLHYCHVPFFLNNNNLCNNIINNKNYIFYRNKCLNKGNRNIDLQQMRIIVKSIE